MKRCVLPIAVVLLLLFATPLFADWELGASFTPMSGGEGDYSENASFFDQSIKGFHFGYTWWRVAYATWDALVMPPQIIYGMTGSLETDDQGNEYYREGYYRPGFLNLFDAGIRLILGPFVVSAGAGVNQLRVYHFQELPDLKTDLGANLRVALGLKFDWWGISVSGTSVFPSFDDVVKTVTGLAGSEFARQKALEAISNNLVPSIVFVMYLQ
jgi:hypothetical protein